MSSITIQVNEQVIDKMKIFYEDDLQTTNNPYARFTAKTEKCTITAYTSNKVLFQGANAEEEATIWTSMNPQKKSTIPTSNKKLETKATNNYFISSIGSDEVGTGDYFGPVVVVATYIPEEHIHHIKELQIDDSKKLTDETIKQIAPKLFNLLPYSLLIVNNEKYNEVMNSSSMNLNKLKAVLHKQAISNLLVKIKKENVTIIIDQFCSIDNFNRYVNESIFSKKIDFHTKAESKFASVACASMMARYIFLQEMDKLSKELNVEILKGASSKVNNQAQELVNKYGKNVLNKIAKLHFRNTENIKF